jgi:hypothetical protein
MAQPIRKLHQPATSARAQRQSRRRPTMQPFCFAPSLSRNGPGPQTPPGGKPAARTNAPGGAVAGDRNAAQVLRREGKKRQKHSCPGREENGHGAAIVNCRASWKLRHAEDRRARKKSGHLRARKRLVSTNRIENRYSAAQPQVQAGQAVEPTERHREVETDPRRLEGGARSCRKVARNPQPRDGNSWRAGSCFHPGLCDNRSRGLV